MYTLIYITVFKSQTSGLLQKYLKVQFEKQIHRTNNPAE